MSTVYQLKDWNFTYGAIDVMQGMAADGDVIIIEFPNPRSSVKVSPDGQVCWEVDDANGRISNVTLRLAQTSRVNAILSAALLAACKAGIPGDAPVAVRNSGGASVFFCLEGAIAGFPGEKVGKESQPVEWKFICPNAMHVVGGA